MNKRARHARRILRDHRVNPLGGWGHSIKLQDLGGKADVWGWWQCPRCFTPAEQERRLKAFHDAAIAAIDGATDTMRHQTWEELKADLGLNGS